MKKIALLEIKQKDKTFYMGVFNPREVIRLIDIPLENTDQKTNRPWKEKRVQEIAKYVAGKLNISDKKDKIKMAKGYMPNCPILCLEKSFKISKHNGMYYIEFPETENEILDYHGAISILDGQHRLISFSDEYIDPDMDRYQKYDMGFIIFATLTFNEKREIFMISNDKQEKVESNVLKLIKRWLGLLTEKEDYLYKITEALHKESISPLRGKIIIGGNKISHGFKASQIIKILDKSGIYDRLKEDIEDEDILLENICTYLNAWKDVYKDKFLNPQYFLGKTTGLRYICYLFPIILDILEEQHKKYLVENISSILTVLYTMTMDDSEVHKSLQLSIRSESGTIAVARLHGMELKNRLTNKKFNIFAGA